MKKRKGKKIKSEFDQKLIDLARVTRVVRGGRRFRFRATLAIGNRKGKVAIGVGKGGDVSDAITKAYNKAKKSLINVSIVEGTIPHEVTSKYKSAKVILKPTKKGKGIVVGGSVRQIIELTGIKDLTGKIIGKGNKVNNALAALKALKTVSSLTANKGAEKEKEIAKEKTGKSTDKKAEKKNKKNTSKKSK